MASTAVRPGSAGGEKPHRRSKRASSAASRGAPPGRALGTAPTSAEPCTPEWPRMGISPQRSRPTIPRARARLIRAVTLSTPKRCWVRPIDQTKTAVFAAA